MYVGTYTRYTDFARELDIAPQIREEIIREKKPTATKICELIEAWVEKHPSATYAELEVHLRKNEKNGDAGMLT